MRLPSTEDQISSLLQSKNLNGLNKEAKWFLYAMGETGARFSEIVGLLPQDITLNAPVPHISITDRIERT